MSPSSVFSFEDQIIYRLASLEATLTNSLKRIDEKIDRYQSDANHKYTTNAADIASVSAKQDAVKEAIAERIDKLRDDIEENKQFVLVNKESIIQRIEPLERWKTQALAQVTAIGALIAIAWSVFGDALQNVVGVR